jgi:hypothetical protein
MSRGIGKVQRQILELLEQMKPAPGTVKVLTAVLSHRNERPISDRQVRQAVYTMEDRGLVELRVQPNPFGRPGVCVFLPGGIAAFDTMAGGDPAWSRPARPPKPEPRKLSDEVGKLARAAAAFADTDPEGEEFSGALVDLMMVADAFKLDGLV